MTVAAIPMLTLCAALHLMHIYAPLDGGHIHKLSASAVKAAYLRGAQQKPQSAMSDAVAATLVRTRRLADSAGRSHHVYVPCFMQVSADAKALIDPCGEVELPPEGKTFDVSLGGIQVWSFTVPGGDDFHTWEQGSTENVAIIFTVMAVLFAVGWIVLRIKFTPYYNAILGSLPPADRMLTPEEEREEIEMKRDNGGADASFVAPLNIYRAVAMFNIARPKDVPRMFHVKLFMSAVVIAFVQVMVPLEMIRVFFQAHKFHGWREMFWFTANAPSFICRFLVLGGASWMLTKDFINKIKDSADANIFILTHQYQDPTETATPQAAGQTTDATSQSAGEQTTDATSQAADCNMGDGDAAATSEDSTSAGTIGEQVGAVGNGDSMAVQYTPLASEEAVTCTCGPNLDEAAEAVLKQWRHNVKHTWCTLSVVVNLVMCALTWFLMLLWIACYNGSIADLATYVVPVTLVLNLDTNYVSTDTNLVDRYKTLVRRLDWENENGKTYSRKIQETAQEISREILQLLTPLGLIFVTVSTWMVDGKVVSAMPFP